MPENWRRLYRVRCGLGSCQRLPSWLHWLRWLRRPRRGLDDRLEGRQDRLHDMPRQGMRAETSGRTTIAEPQTAAEQRNQYSDRLRWEVLALDLMIGFLLRWGSGSLVCRHD